VFAYKGAAAGRTWAGDRPRQAGWTPCGHTTWGPCWRRKGGAARTTAAGLN